MKGRGREGGGERRVMTAYFNTCVGGVDLNGIDLNGMESGYCTSLCLSVSDNGVVDNP